MHSFEVHSDESACRKSGRLGLEQVPKDDDLLLRIFDEPSNNEYDDDEDPEIDNNEYA